MKFKQCVLVLSVFLLFVCIAELHAAWLPDGTPVCTMKDDQVFVQVIPQGSDGVLLTWADRRTGYWDIYAQRLSSSGDPQWTAQGVPVCTANHHQAYPQFVSDGAGGAIITWHDSRNGNYTDDTYVQRIDDSGTVLWTIDGVALCTSSGRQNQQQIVSDGCGGAIVSWQDERNGNWDIYAQRVDASGTPLWTSGSPMVPSQGVAVCTAASSQQFPQMSSDGAGGAIITYWDSRKGNWDIYAQRINPSGTALWTSNGVPICTLSDGLWRPEICSDGAGGAYIAWADYRYSNYDIYLQHIDASGTPLWTQNGIAVCDAPNAQETVDLVEDGSGGVYVAWQDSRKGGRKIYAQRIDSAGNNLWTYNGIELWYKSVAASTPHVCRTSDNNLVAAWYDNIWGSSDIFAQLVSQSGELLWETIELVICGASGDQNWQQLASDGCGGAIIAWGDRRYSNFDVFAQRTPEPPLSFDIKPGTCPNVLNVQFLENMDKGNANTHAILKKGGILPTAVCGTANLDVNDIDLSTLLLNGIAPLKSSYEDVTTPPTDGGACPCTTDGPDGLIDLTLKFSKLEIAEFLQGFDDGEIVTLTLTGQLYNGRSIRGKDCIQVIRNEEESEEEPGGTTVDLSAPNPNPFNPEVTISFYLPERMRVDLSVFDAKGALVKTLLAGELDRGRSNAMWDGTDAGGAPVASGVYFYRLRTNSSVVSRKMILLK